MATANLTLDVRIEWIVFMIALPTYDENGSRTDLGKFAAIEDALQACEAHAAERGDTLDRDNWQRNDQEYYASIVYNLPDRYYQMYAHIELKGPLKGE